MSDTKDLLRGVFFMLNARLAMLGFVVAIGTYATTGQILPGIF